METVIWIQPVYCWLLNEIEVNQTKTALENIKEMPEVKCSHSLFQQNHQELLLRIKKMERVFLMLSVSALCCIHVASYSPKYPLLINTNIQHCYHKIHKRQEDSSNQNPVCHSILHADGCTNGRFQEYVYALLRCNELKQAQDYQDSCRRNSMERYCGEMDNSMISSNVSEACDITGSSCNPECKNVLINARSEFGCCVNLNNDSSHLYSYSLWSRCGVELVTEECSPSTITASSEVDSSCKGKTVQESFISATCRQQYVESTRKRLSATEGCQGFVYPPSNMCNANGNGVYCNLLMDFNITEVSVNCNNTSTCDPGCLQTINNTTNVLGCCINDLYNSTSNRLDWMSYEFWSRCGLQSPGFCKQYLNNGSVFIKASSSLIIIAAIIAMFPFLALLQCPFKN